MHVAVSINSVVFLSKMAENFPSWGSMIFVRVRVRVHA